MNGFKKHKEKKILQGIRIIPNTSQDIIEDCPSTCMNFETDNDDLNIGIKR